MSSTTSPQATWKLLGLKKPCQNSKSIVPFKWWHPQWEKILDFMHQWHELQALDYINRLKISLKLFNFCLVVLGFIWCQRQGLPLNNDTGAISIKCLIHWPAGLPRQVKAVLLSLFPGLTGYCLLVGSSSLLLQLSITNVPVILWQKPNFLEKMSLLGLVHVIQMVLCPPMASDPPILVPIGDHGHETQEYWTLTIH